MEFLQNILDIFNTIGGKLPDWLAALTGLVTAASAVAALTPTLEDDNFIAKILNVLKKLNNWLALNVLNAKPKE